MIVVAFAEVISIGAIMPFLTVLISPKIVFENMTVKPVLVTLGINEANELLLPITIFFILAVVVANSLRMYLYWLQLHLAHQIGSDFSLAIFRQTLFQTYEYHLEKNSSESISAIINKSDSIVGQAVLPMMVIISSSMILAAIAAPIIFFNPVLVVSSLVGFSITYFVISYFFKKQIDKQSEIININGSKLIKIIQESVGGIRDVLINHSQDVYCKYFREVDKPHKKAHSIVWAMIGLPRFVIEGVGIIVIVILAYQLTSDNRDAALVVPILGVVVLALQRLLPIMQQGYASWSLIRSGRPALMDVITLLESPPAEKLTPSEDNSPLNFHEDIVLSDVSFSYKSNTNIVLKNINLRLKKGSRIGIIGTTGSGKSTLLDIIMGLILPTQGLILVDGVVLTKRNIMNWRKCIAHVPQNIFIADASISQNIAFGIAQENIDMDRVRYAATQAQLEKTIESLPQQYNTIVGERGSRLSGGQRQRIGIARALYKNSDVIIFDEGTSALDSKTELEIMNSFNNLGNELTIVMVAHRLSTLKSCNQIITLEHGEVKEISRYDDLKK